MNGAIICGQRYEPSDFAIQPLLWWQKEEDWTGTFRKIGLVLDPTACP